MRSQKKRKLKLVFGKRAKRLPSCGGCGKRTSDLRACARSSWPTVPIVAQYIQEDSGNVICTSRRENESYDEMKKRILQENKKLEAALQVPPCKGSLKLCLACVSSKGCSGCQAWECETCTEDLQTPKTFSAWHDQDPRIYEDCYGYRGETSYQSFSLARCYACGKTFCLSCVEKCGADGKTCTNVICDQCDKIPSLRLKETPCINCKDTIDNVDYDCIPPVDDSRVCRACFYAGDNAYQCGCGEPSFDPMNLCHRKMQIRFQQGESMGENSDSDHESYNDDDYD